MDISPNSQYSRIHIRWYTLRLGHQWKVKGRSACLRAPEHLVSFSICAGNSSFASDNTLYAFRYCFIFLQAVLQCMILQLMVFIFFWNILLMLPSRYNFVCCWLALCIWIFEHGLNHSQHSRWKLLNWKRDENWPATTDFLFLLLRGLTQLLCIFSLKLLYPFH